MANDAIIADLKKSIETWNVALCKEATQKAIDAKMSVSEIMDKGLGEGMAVIGQKFNDAEIFLPQVVAASKTMEVALKMLEPLMSGGSSANKGTVVMGTVEGDVHDIGKSICSTMLQCAGFDVHDLGRDVPKQKFIDECNNGCTMCGMSALMTTTMTVQRDVIEMMKEAGIRDKVVVMVGGAPVTQSWCDKIGADVYGESASETVSKVKDL